MEDVQQRELLRDAPLRMVAARISRSRKAAGLSLDALAGKASTSRQHVINLEKGRHRPRLEMLQRIAAATGRPVEFFLVEESDPNPFPAEAA